MEFSGRLNACLGLDHVPGGVSPTGDDNLILDTVVDPTTGHTVSPSGFGHPSCDAVGVPSSAIITNLPTNFPIG